MVRVASPVTLDLQPGGGLALGGKVRVLQPETLELQTGGGLALGGRRPVAPEVGDCEQCPAGAWNVYRVIVEGAQNDFAFWNGEWLVEYAGECQWLGDGPPEADIIRFLPSLFEGDTFITVFLTAPAASSGWGVQSFTGCLGPEWTVDLGSHQFPTVDWPATIRVEAAPSF
jgi:hypothetical protein